MGFLICMAVQADQRTWSGGGTGYLWDSSANWDGIAPVAGDALEFAGSVKLSNTNDFVEGTAFSALTFAGGAGSFVLSGNGISLSGAITNNSSSLQTIELDVEFLTESVIVDTTGASIRMDGELSGDGFTVTGGNYCNLYAANIFTGDVTVASGDMKVYDEDGLGTTNGVTYVASGAQLRFYGTNVVEETIDITGDSTTVPQYDGALRVDSGRTEFKAPLISHSSRIKCGENQELVISGGITGNSVVLGADSGATIIITNTPIVVDGSALEHFHSAGNIILAVTNNIWGGVQIASCKFRTDVPYALPAGRYFEMGVSYSPTAYFNMNGNDQSIGDLQHNGLDANSPGPRRIWSDEPATLTVDQSNNRSVFLDIEGAVSLVKTGAAELTLGWDSSTTTGRTVILEGQLGIKGEGSLGANPDTFVADQLTLNGGTLAIAENITLDDGNRGITLGSSGGTFDVDSGVSLTIDQVIAGSGSLTKIMGGDLILQGNNSYAGQTEIKLGAVVVTSEDNLGAAPATFADDQLRFTGGRVRAAATFTIDDPNRGIALSTGTWGGFSVDAGQTLTVNNVIGGDGYFVKQGEGTLILGAANTFTGRFNIESGVVEVDSEDKLGANPPDYLQEKLTLNGGALHTTASFAIDDTNRGVRMAANGGTFDVDAGTTLIISNVVDGTGNMAKTGAGTLVLGG